ncbi:MAG: carboxypeptidase-like regulatory domain-containing protein [Candidatus Binatia bacterium]
MAKKVLRWIGIVVLLLLFASGKVAYVGLPITATVVDAQTGKPIEGAIVVAIWQLYGGMEGGNWEGQAKVLETVSDANGRFHFSWWGPRIHTPLGELTTRAPDLLLFARGYDPKRVRNADSRIGVLQASDWNGKTIPMSSRTADSKAYAAQLEHFDPMELFYDSCGWQHAPRLLVALDEEAQMLRAQGPGLDPGTSLRGRDEARLSACGSVETYVRGHVR